MTPGTTTSSTTRRALFAGAGAVGAAAMLAACSDDSPASTPNGATTSAPAGGTTGGTSGGAAGGIAKTSEIPVGGGKVISASGVVVTQPVAGTFKAFDHMCTHQQCPVASVDGGTINCDCHFSKFSISDGSVVSPPATQALPEKKIVVEGDTIKLA
ncbi:MAG: Rieske (2Fe-2S) protein [Hamadaea sp.]|nr:Rieske (2Fe-2S) protein [Hamadaea sp.]